MAKKSKTEEVENTSSVAAVRFTVAPIGPYGLSYFAGDVAEIDALLAAAIVENGHGEYLTEGPQETAPEVTEETEVTEAPEVTAENK